jgi:hypothetical protein
VEPRRNWGLVVGGVVVLLVSTGIAAWVGIGWVVTASTGAVSAALVGQFRIAWFMCAVGGVVGIALIASGARRRQRE